MNDKKVLAAIAAVMVVVAAAVGSALVLGGKSEQSENNQTTTRAESTEQNLTQSDQSMLPESNATAEAGSTTNVGITDYAYDPKTIEIKVGDTVTWTNNDTARHDVTSEDGISNGPASELLGKGESYSFEFTKAGTFDYFCSPHPYMKASVVVTE